MGPGVHPDPRSVAVYDGAAEVLEVTRQWKLGDPPGLRLILPVFDYYEFGIG